MKLQKGATDKGFNGTEVVLDGKRPVKVRAVLLDEDGCMALMYLPKYKHNGDKDLYMIPGGGVDNREDLKKALKREMLEETGCGIDIVEEIGYITNTEDEDIWTAVTYYYIAKVAGKKGQLQLTEHEKDSQFELQWHSLEEALKIIENQAVEDNCKIVKFRDKLVVAEAIKLTRQKNML